MYCTVFVFAQGPHAYCLINYLNINTMMVIALFTTIVILNLFYYKAGIENGMCVQISIFQMFGFKLNKYDCVIFVHLKLNAFMHN